MFQAQNEFSKFILHALVVEPGFLHFFVCVSFSPLFETLFFPSHKLAVIVPLIVSLLPARSTGLSGRDMP